MIEYCIIVSASGISQCLEYEYDNSIILTVNSIPANISS